MNDFVFPLFFHCLYDNTDYIDLIILLSVG